MSGRWPRILPWSLGLLVLVIGFGKNPLAGSVQNTKEKSTTSTTKTPARTAPAAQPTYPPLVVLTSEQDRQRMMNDLRISGFPSTPMPYLAATYNQSTAD